MVTQRESTAYHEAGHAVVAYRLGLVVDSTTIRPDPAKETLGVSLSEGPWMNGSTDDDQITVLYAGLAAERLVEPGAQVEDGAFGDYEQAAVLHGLESRPAHLEERAATVVAEHRAAIEAVAQALLEHETLPGDEAAVVVDCVDEGLDWRVELLRYRALRVGT